MKFRTTISILAASVLALTSLASYAGQGGGRGGGQGGGGMDRTQQVDRDRSYDRDRMADRTRDAIPERQKDRDRDQDRTKMQDPSRMKNQDIYGNALMSNAERETYRNELGKADTRESRAQFQAQHEETMQNRALRQGQDLVPPGQGPIYGGEFMSVQERNEYREQLRLIDSDPEREQFQVQHRDRIDQRDHALERKVEEAE